MKNGLIIGGSIDMGFDTAKRLAARDKRYYFRCRLAR